MMNQLTKLGKGMWESMPGKYIANPDLSVHQMPKRNELAHFHWP